MIVKVKEKELGHNEYLAWFQVFVITDHPHEACQLNGAYCALSELWCAASTKHCVTNEDAVSYFGFRVNHQQKYDLERVIDAINKMNQ